MWPQCVLQAYRLTRCRTPVGVVNNNVLGSEYAAVQATQGDRTWLGACVWVPVPVWSFEIILLSRIEDRWRSGQRPRRRTQVLPASGTTET